MNDHISIEEIRQDIYDTEDEIEQMEREIEGYKLIGDRMFLFRADSRRDGIRKRQEFIYKLKGIIQSRLTNETK